MRKRRVLPLLLGLAAFLLACASLPHLHAGPDSGFWNADHDLTLMATFGTHACQLDAMPVLALGLALAAAPPAPFAHPRSARRPRVPPPGPPLRDPPAVPPACSRLEREPLRTRPCRPVAHT